MTSFSLHVLIIKLDVESVIAEPNFALVGTRPAGACRKTLARLQYV